jgi:hypothetical protein
MQIVGWSKSECWIVGRWNEHCRSFGKRVPAHYVGSYRNYYEATSFDFINSTSTAKPVIGSAEIEFDPCANTMFVQTVAKTCVVPIWRSGGASIALARSNELGDLAVRVLHLQDLTRTSEAALACLRTET